MKSLTTSSLLTLLLLQTIVYSAITSTESREVKLSGQQCERDQECLSECCYQSQCSKTEDPCAAERIEILKKIVAQMSRESDNVEDGKTLLEALDDTVYAIDSESTMDPSNHQLNTVSSNNLMNVKVLLELQKIAASEQSAFTTNLVEDVVLVEATTEETQTSADSSTQTADSTAQDDSTNTNLQSENTNSTNTSASSSNTTEYNTNSSSSTNQTSPLVPVTDGAIDLSNKGVYETILVVILVFLLLAMIGAVFLGLKGDTMQVRLKEKHWLSDQKETDEQFIRIL